MNYAPQPKKMIIVNILDILRKYSDADHRLSQAFIQNKLETEYAMKVDRKAVRRNLLNLIDSGYDIEYTETARKNYSSRAGEYEDNSTLSDFYIDRDFDNSEIKLLIDSVVFSQHIPKGDRDRLIKKLENLSNVYFKSSAEGMEVINSVTSQNKDWFYNLDIINEAIIKKNKIRLTYSEYGTDKKLHPTEEITVCPYKIIAHNNHYFLISNEPPFDDFNHYRIDRITAVNILYDDNFVPIKSLDVYKYIHSHPFLFSGKEEHIQILADRSVLGDVFDCFGDDVSIIEKPDNKLEIFFSSAENDFYYWALQHGDKVEVIKPLSLRYRIRETAEAVTCVYLTTQEDRFQKAIDNAKRRRIFSLNRLDLRNKSFDLVPRRVLTLSIMHCIVDDYSFVKKFDELKELRIYNRVDDFSFLQDIDSLTTLVLQDTGINDLSIVDGLTLKKLWLIEDNVNNMEVVYRMPSLKELTISRSLATMIDVKKLKELNPELKITLLNNFSRENI